MSNWGETYQGWTVTVLGTAHVMANTPEEAKAKVLEGLRKQNRVLFLTVEADGTQPCDCIVEGHDPEQTAPEIIARKAMKSVDTGYSNTPESVDTPTSKAASKAPRKRFCPVHKADLQDQQACTPGFVGCTHKFWKAR